MFSLNCKNVQHVKIYLPCNFEVNPITHFGVVALFSSPLWAIAITWRPSSICKLFQKSSPLKPLGQFKPNLAWIILRGFPLKWPLLLKIEISSNGQNYSILSHNVPKFELFDGLFNIYYGIFYELWTFADFDWLCKLEKRGDEIKKKIFSSETTEPISTKLCWNESWVVTFQNYVRHFRPPTKMAATAELNLT
jgi:hypothetical protein